ncbi:MAG: fibronectin type III domain-containing protein [Saprospiraceae bacterium]
MKRLLTLVLVLSSALALQAQTLDPETKALLDRQGIVVDTSVTDTLIDPVLDPHISLLASFAERRIELRWAPTTPSAWLLANYYGYYVERLDLDDTTATTFERLAGPLKPWSLEEWETFDAAGQSDEYHLVAAEMLHGDHFKNLVRGGPDVYAASQLKELFGITMLVADLSWPTAKGMALAYTDTPPVPGHEYLYRVRLADQSPEIYVREGAIMVVAAPPAYPQPPKINKVEEGEQVISLHMFREYHDERFTALHIERADSEAGPWQRLNKQPFIHATNAKGGPGEYIVYSDSVASNYRPYCYRILGVTPFGKTSDPSAIVCAQGRDRTPPPAAQNVVATTTSGPIVTLTWDYPENAPSDFEGFWIGKSSESLSGFQQLHDVVLSPSTRSFVDPNPDSLGLNYYMVGAIDTAGNGTPSLVANAIIIDSFPPQPPVGLEGSIDSNGVVTLRWNLNEERDIRGYQVYFANKEDHVFAGLTGHPLRDTVFTDTVVVKALKRDVFYYVVAVDLTSNYSQPSDTLRLVKPDIVAPAPPVLTELLVTPAGVVGRWVPSSSEDVEAYEWLRRGRASDAWSVLERWGPNREDFELRDATAKPGKLYEYAIRCVDSSGYNSDLAYVLRARGPRQVYESIAPSEVVFDPEQKGVIVRWVRPANLSDDAVISIYRAIDGGPYDMVKRVSVASALWLDRYPRGGHSYEYALQLRGGGVLPSELSGPVSVTLK